jgi:hypothetical protein
MKTLLTVVTLTLLTTAATAQGRRACPSVEFAELQSLSAPEIHALYCEYDKKLDRAMDSARVNNARNSMDDVSACVDERLRLSRIMAKTGVSTSCGS